MNDLATKRQYTVWLSGGDSVSLLLTKQEATDLSDQYKDDGYDDVVVELVLK